MNKRILWKKIKQRGPIIWDNTLGEMRSAGNLYYWNEDGTLSDEIMETMPATYHLGGMPAYNSYSALVPCGNKKSPLEFMYYDYDEDEDCGMGWESTEVENPLKWKTEAEFLKGIGKA